MPAIRITATGGGARTANQGDIQTATQLAVWGKFSGAGLLALADTEHIDALEIGSGAAGSECKLSCMFRRNGTNIDVYFRVAGGSEVNLGAIPRASLSGSDQYRAYWHYHPGHSTTSLRRVVKIYAPNNSLLLSSEANVTGAMSTAAGRGLVFVGDPRPDDAVTTMEWDVVAVLTAIRAGDYGDIPAPGEAGLALLTYFDDGSGIGARNLVPGGEHLVIQPSTEWIAGDTSGPAPEGAYFAGAGAQVAATASGGVTPAIPAGAQVNDIALAIVSGRPTDTSQPTEPSGWPLIATSLREVGTNDLRLNVYARRLTGSDTDPTFNCPTNWQGTSAGISGQIVLYRGVDPTTMLDLAVVDGLNAAAAATWTPTGLTTATDGALAISIVASADDNALAMSAQQGFVPRMGGADYDTTTGGDHAIGVADRVVPTAGSVTYPTWQQTAVGNDAWAGISLALRPSAGGEEVEVAVSDHNPAQTDAAEILHAAPEHDAAVTDRNPDQIDAAALTHLAPEHAAMVAEGNPGQVDAVAGLLSIEHTASVADANPAQTDAAAALHEAPEFAGSVVDHNPGQTDSATAGFATAHEASVSESNPPQTDSATGAWAVDQGAVVSESNPGQTDAAAATFEVIHSAGVSDANPSQTDIATVAHLAPEHSGSVGDANPPQQDFALADFQTVHSATIAESNPPQSDAAAALFSTAAHDAVVSESNPGQTDSVEGLHVPPAVAAVVDANPGQSDDVAVALVPAAHSASVADANPEQDDDIEAWFDAPEWAASVADSNPVQEDIVAAWASPPDLAALVSEWNPAQEDSAGGVMVAPMLAVVADVNPMQSDVAAALHNPLAPTRPFRGVMTVRANESPVTVRSNRGTMIVE